MGTALVEPWIEESRPFFVSLSDAAGRIGRTAPDTSTVDSTKTISGMLRSLQLWMGNNPCPDKRLSDRVHLVAARYGYLELIDAPDRTTMDDRRRAALDERTRMLNEDLVALVAEVEQFRSDNGADSDEN